MKKLILATSIVMLTACSSGGSSSKPEFDGDHGWTNPDATPEAPIEDERGYSIVDDVVYLDGEVLGTIKDDGSGKMRLVDDQGNLLAHIEQTGDGYRIVIAHAGSGQFRDHYHIVKSDDNKWTIDWATSVVDHGWGVDADSIGKPEPAAFNKEAAKKKAQHLRASIKAKLKR